MVLPLEGGRSGVGRRAAGADRAARRADQRSRTLVPPASPRPPLSRSRACASSSPPARSSCARRSRPCSLAQPEVVHGHRPLLHRRSRARSRCRSSCHFVPRTVADEFRPRVRKWPLTLENSVRRRFAAARAPGFAAPPFGSFVLHPPRPPPFIESVVSGFFFVCPSTKRPLAERPLPRGAARPRLCRRQSHDPVRRVELGANGQLTSPRRESSELVAARQLHAHLAAAGSAFAVLPDRRRRRRRPDCPLMSVRLMLSA